MTLLVSILVLLAVLATSFAVVRVTNGGETGAASAGEAAEGMFDALADQDVIGVLEMLDPGERDVARTFVENLEDDLSRLGIIEDTDLGDVQGIEFDVQGLMVQSTPLAEGVAEVRFTGGTLSYETRPDDVPIGDVLRDLILANGGDPTVPADADAGPISEDGEAFLVTTETNGRWHVSLGYTMAEYIRRDEGQPFPDPALAVQPNGADSPEAAVDELAAAISDFDLERMIAILPPDSMGALQAYTPLFLPDAQADLDAEMEYDEVELNIEITDAETSSVDGGTRVVPQGVTLSYSDWETGQSTLTWEGDCIHASGEIADDWQMEIGETSLCTDDFGFAELDENISTEERDEMEELGGLVEDFQVGIVVTEHEGSYYVDPFGTFSDWIDQLLDGVERSDLEEGGILYRLFTDELTLFEDEMDDFSDEFSSDDSW